MAIPNRFGRWTRTFPGMGDVDRVEFIAPDGSTVDRKTFTHQPAKLTYDDHGYEHLALDGKPLPAVRFTPKVVGLYKYRAYRGDEVIEEGGFRCEASDHPGYVVVNPGEPRYFACSNGDPFCPIGLCMAGPPRYRLPKGTAHFETGDAWATLGASEYRRWFRLLSENGGNFARIWLSHPYFEVETEVAGELDLAAFARLDAVVEAAREYGIRLKLCFEHFRTFEPGTPFSKTLRHPDDGREPESLNAWLREDTWRELWLEKVKAYTARYGGDPVVAVWELWNEMDCVEADWEAVVGWTKAMLTVVRQMAPFQMVTNSLGSFDDPEKEAAFKDFELHQSHFNQVHRYLDQGAPWEICREDPVALTKQAIDETRRLFKPILLAETGAVNDRHTGPFRYYRMDDDGLIFNDTTFPAFFAGAAGTGQIWHWDEYVDQKNLWRFYKPFAELVEGVPFENQQFLPVNLSDERIWFLALRGRFHILIWVRNKQDTWQSALRDGEETPWIEGMTVDVSDLNVKTGKVTVLSPWGEVEGEAVLEDGKLTLPRFKHGMMLRIGA